MRSGQWALVLLLGLFLGLTVLYNVSIPPYESPDELQHTAFVVWLADRHGLPVVDQAAPGPWEQEGTQPPLYYGLVATLVGALPHMPAGSLARLNPNATIGNPLRPDNKNRVLHDLEEERWPYNGRVWFVHLARGISTLMAVGTLVAIYFLGRTVFPEREGIALGMVGLVAFLPQFLFLSVSINNDNLVILLASWVLVLLVRWFAGGHLPGLLPLAGVGALLGLAALSKFSGLLLWPLAAGAMLWLAWRHRRLRWLIPAGLLVFGIALALCGWWFLRNLQLYGDLSGLSTHLGVIGMRRRFPSSPAAWVAEFRGLRYSFWGLFGWFNVLMPDPFYWIVDILTVLGVVGFGISLRVAHSRREQPSWRLPALAMLALWIGLVALALLRWTRLTSASQGRLLFPALAAIALILVVGWAEVVPRRARRSVGIVALVGWATWAALCPFLVIQPAYALPERAQTLADLPVVPRNLHVRYGECCELVGYVPLDRPVHPGERIPLTLVWRALAETREDYSLFIHATAADGQRVGQVDSYHGGGMYPTSQWRPGEFIADTVYVPISRKAQGPMLVRFNVGLYERATGHELPRFAADGQPVEVVWAGEAALEPSTWPTIQPGSSVDALFGEKIRLASAEVVQTGGLAPRAIEVHPNDIVTVTLQWEALTRITEDYVGFVHLVDPSGRDVAQDDHPPLNGQYPTRVWFPGTVLSDPYRLKLPEALAEGTYELWGGLYHAGSGQRLPAVSPQTGERWKDDLVYLGRLTVTTETP
jgi:Dolichyl-phosphate-mannose-protein mannosyltransferase